VTPIALTIRRLRRIRRARQAGARPNRFKFKGVDEVLALLQRIEHEPPRRRALGDCDLVARVVVTEDGADGGEGVADVDAPGRAFYAEGLRRPLGVLADFGDVVEDDLG